MKVGQLCSFYHEGGHGANHWVRGWRAGTVREMPSRGARKLWARIELPAERWTYDQKLGWVARPLEMVWVHRANVNELGDCRYHGLRLVEQVKERKVAKKKAQTLADKRKRRAVIAK